VKSSAMMPRQPSVPKRGVSGIVTPSDEERRARREESRECGRVRASPHR
jgi:hypothetical protein